MTFDQVVRLEQLRAASAIAGQLMSTRGTDPETAATEAVEALSEITRRLFDDEDLHIDEIEDEEEENAEGISIEDICFAGRSLNSLETKAITDTLEYVDGDKKQAAEMLAITPQTLGKKMKRLEVEA